MDRILERIGLALLAIAAIAYVVLLLEVSLEDAQAGIFMLALLGGFAFLLAQALKDRLGNKEDDYYSKNVEK